MENLLHSGFINNTLDNPDRVAVLWEESDESYSLTYSELYNKALTVTKYLKDIGIQKGDRVAIALPKSVEQIISILGVLGIGAVYVPINIKQPLSRIESIARLSKLKAVITSDEIIDVYKSIADISIIDIKNIDYSLQEDRFCDVSTEDSAYIIFTSGTTGEPKGVEISHGAASNTIVDINNRFSITGEDRIFAISEIDFDLSVYDIFGMLYAGGSIVIANENIKKEAFEWGRYIDKYNITVWNSVPTFFDMLLIAIGDKPIIGKLNTVMLSGDWVRPNLYKRLRIKNNHCRFIALGGATEASIWSNYYEVTRIKDEWEAIPYGEALGNQTIQILDENGDRCKLNVQGDIYIGGLGLAKGYIGNEELTNKKFIMDRHGNRLYHTGDVGKYIEGDCIEFLGRSDMQVKLRGYRIELEEVTRALLQNEIIENATTVLINGNNVSKDYLASAITVSKNRFDICKKEKRPMCKENDIDEAIKQLIIEILDLDNLLPCNIEEVITYNNISEESKNIFNLWIRWLVNNKYIDKENNILSKGELYKSNELKKETKELYNMMKLKQKLIKEMLSGEKELFSVLEDDILSPEVISAKDTDILDSVDKLLEVIKDKCDERNEEKLRLLIWNGNNSILIKKFIEKIKECNVEIVISSKHTSITNELRTKLDKYKNNISYVKIEDKYIELDMLNSFDMVIAINTMHTCESIENEMFKINGILKSGGILISLDMNELPSVSLLTSAFLEDGYEKYNLKNRGELYNPMLQGEQWKYIFNQAGFQDVNNIPVCKDKLDIVIAENLIKEEITKEDIKEHLQKLIPSYMIADRYILMYELPLSNNGKINNKAIVDIFTNIVEDIEIVECATETEKIVANLWKEIIMLQDVGATQNFFTIGGDSLSATHFITKVKEEFGIEITLKEFFENGSLRDISRIIDEHIEDNNDLDMEIGEI